MSLDLDILAEFVAHRLFEPRRGVMRERQRLRTVDLKIGGD